MSDVLDTLFDTILDRYTNPQPGSYTVRLLDAGEDEILKKVGEEAMEVILAAKGQGDERLVSDEIPADLHAMGQAAGGVLGNVGDLEAQPFAGPEDLRDAPADPCGKKGDGGLGIVQGYKRSVLGTRAGAPKNSN